MAWKAIWGFIFLFPTVLILAANVGLIYVLHMYRAFYAIPLLGLALLAYFHFQKGKENNHLLVAAPFWVILGFFICFGAFLPQLEEFRPYDELGEALAQSEQVDPKTPVMIENTLIHNIPFYAKRFVIRDQTPQDIQAHVGPALAFVRASSMAELAGFESLWSGMIYDFPSESQFAKFIMACVVAQEEDLSKFALYHLVIPKLALSMSQPSKRFSKTKYLYRAYKYRYRDDVDELKYLVNNISKGDFALDVGAHKGGYLHWMRKGVGTKGKVVAFEPQPSLFEYLSDMRQAYRYENLTLHHAGLSSEEGELDLYIPKTAGLTSPEATFEKREDDERGHYVKVPVLQLDKLLAERTSPVNFIKMDVEGHELEVFKGAADLLEKDQPKLMFECENRHLNSIVVEDIFAYLSNLGYQGSFFWNGGLVPVTEFKADQHQQIQEDKEIVNKKRYANNFVFEPIS